MKRKKMQRGGAPSCVSVIFVSPIPVKVIHKKKNKEEQKKQIKDVPYFFYLIYLISTGPSVKYFEQSSIN